MARVEIRPATAFDAEQLAPQLRRGDADECAACGYTALEALLISLRVSKGTERALVIDGEVAAIWGVAPITEQSGYVWALSGKAADRHRVTYLKVSIAMVDLLRERWRILVGAVDTRYTGAVRWLERLGFSLAPAQMTVGGVAFREFSLRRDTWD